MQGRPLARQSPWRYTLLSHRLPVWGWLGFNCLDTKMLELESGSTFIDATVPAFCRKRNLRKPKRCAEGNTISQWQSQTPNSGLPAPCPLFFNIAMVWANKPSLDFRIYRSQFNFTVNPETPYDLI